MEIIIRHSAPSCRGLASPKTGVGVWRLVLIVCLPFLGQIACFWWGVRGGRAGGVGLRGSDGAWVGLCGHMLERISAGDLLRRERTLNAAASSPHVPGVWPRASQGRAGVRDEISTERKTTFLLVFRNDELGYRPSFEGLRDFGNACRYNRITPPPSLPACLCSRLMHGSTRSHHPRVAQGIVTWGHPPLAAGGTSATVCAACPAGTYGSSGACWCVCKCWLAMCGTMCAC